MSSLVSRNILRLILELDPHREGLQLGMFFIPPHYQTESESYLAVVGATTGCVPAPDGYLRAVKAICKRYGVLFCADEIMSGSEFSRVIRE